MKTILAIAGMIVFGAAGFLAGRFSASSSVDRGQRKISSPLPSVAASASALPSTMPAIAGPSSDPRPAWNESRWKQLSGQPGTVARNDELASLLEKLAVTDPQRAMTLAQAETNLKLREALLQSVLRGWARSSPTNAAQWALAVADPSARETALTSVLTGALATDPDAAVKLCRLACEQDPGGAAGYGSRMIDALCAAGDFDAAAQLAGSDAGNDGPQRAIWMAEAYSKWAELQPDQAGAAALAIPDASLRNEALHGVVGGWATADPAGLANFLSQLPSGGDRGLMLGQALQSWVGEDPAAAAEWINDHTPDFGPDLDKGIEAVATLNTIKPELAVGWAESIDDEQLRSSAVTDILRNWVQTDFASARNFFETTSDLQPADRQQIAQIIAGIEGQAAAQ